MAEAELRNMIMNFRVSDLQVLLGFAGRNKTGKKQELQVRALDLVKINSPAVDMKVRELHNRRYHHQLVARPNNYEIPDRNVNDRPLSHYDSSLNNNYAARCNSSVRPTPVNQGPSSSYSTTAKSYVPSLPNTNSLPQYNSFTDVKFKELPFFDVLYILMNPSSLVPDAAERFQETTYVFTLSPQQAHDISVSKDASGNYECQILLRFCLLETSCEQEDNFPPSICVKVNGKIVQLPSPIPTNRPGVEPKRPSKPVNITSDSKLSPTVSNVVTISWASTYGRSYAAALYIARQLTSIVLLQRLKSNGVQNPDHTTAMIKEKLQQGQDSEIATTSLRGSLICPLGKVKMELPCRAVTCTHLQCFDASLYIQMNEKKPKWICPVCDKPALFRTLAIDGLFMDIAAKVPSDCTEVQFHEDGSWTPILPVKNAKEAKKATIEKGLKKNSCNKKSVEIVELNSDSDSDEVSSYNPVLDKVKSDVTVSSDPLSPMVFLPPSTNITHSATPPASPFLATSTSLLGSIPEDPVHMSSNLQGDTAEPLCILPDVSSQPDNSMPSTSSSSPGLGSNSFPHVPFSSLDVSYCPSMSNTFPEQLGLIGGNQSTPAYNGFDFYSLLQLPEDEQQKSKEFERKENVSPEVIPLD